MYNKIYKNFVEERKYYGTNKSQRIKKKNNDNFISNKYI